MSRLCRSKVELIQHMKITASEPDFSNFCEAEPRSLFCASNRLKSWNTGEGSDQSLWPCFAAGLNQGLLSSVAQAMEKKYGIMTQNLPWSIFTATVNGISCVIADFRRGLTGGITESLRDIVVACFMVPLYTLPKAPSPCSSSRDTRSLSTSQWSIINALLLVKEKIIRILI